MSSSDVLIPLLVASSRGDQTAFQSLYEKTSAHLFGVCLRILRREDLAEEALQDAFVKIWHHASDYHAEKGTVMTWLISIVRYRALDLLRKRDDALIANDEALLMVADDAPGPLERTLKDADDNVLDNCMNDLQEQQRKTITLAFMHGLTHDELTTHLKAPLGTVKSWIRRGLQALKRCLEA